MKNRKTRKKPSTRQNLRHAKKRLAKTIKVLLKKSTKAKPITNTEDDPDFPGIFKRPSGLRSYDRNNSRFNGVHPEFYFLNEFKWMGLLTLKFHSTSYSKDNDRGRKNRLNFLKAFMENLRIKLGISSREFNWYACEEFGFTGAGHLHVIFSFDYLKEKNRMDKLKMTDYSENSHFFKEGKDTVILVSHKLELDPRAVDFHWRPMWENEGLVSYFCKKEFGREEKHFDFSAFWTKRGLVKAT